MLIVVGFSSCNNDECVETEDTEKSELLSEEFKTTFSESDYHLALNEFSSAMQTTRAYGLSEEMIKKAIKPFTRDGEFIIEQLLNDKTSSDEEKVIWENLDECQLAMLSVIANSLIYDVEDDTRAATNSSLHCLSEAIVGGGPLVGTGTWVTILKIGGKTALKRAACALGGMVGGAIAAAMFINDYNACMNR